MLANVQGTVGSVSLALDGGPAHDLAQPHHGLRGVLLHPSREPVLRRGVLGWAQWCVRDLDRMRGAGSTRSLPARRRRPQSDRHGHEPRRRHGLRQRHPDHPSRGHRQLRGYGREEVRPMDERQSWDGVLYRRRSQLGGVFGWSSFTATSP
jgi:hypothetical protein